MPVFQTSHTYLTDRNIKTARDPPLKVLRAHFALLDPEEKVIAAAARLVRRNLLHVEILGQGFDSAADAGQIRGQQRRGLKRVD
jgi:hypothetical protein